jgi:hypothetical protein
LTSNAPAIVVLTVRHVDRMAFANGAAAAREQAQSIQLLAADSDLARDLGPDDAALAHRLVVPLVDAPPGPWAPHEAARYGTGVTGLVLLDGVLTREVLLGDRIAGQLLSPGDVVVPWSEPAALLPARVRWTVNEPARLAVLDERFARAVARWPSLAARVQERLTAQADRAAVHTAISQLGRVDLRVLALLWHLAERWGRVGPDGVVVPLRLTHATLGRLVGAQRPTVTLAVGELDAQGAVRRRPDGSWLLRPESRDRLTPPERAGAPAASTAARIAGPAVRVAPPDRPLVRDDVLEGAPADERGGRFRRD